MNAQEFQAAAIAAFKKQFPNGYAKASKLALGSGVCLSFGLIGKLDDQISKIRENDPMRLMFFIHDDFIFDSEEQITGKLVLENERSSFSTLPDSPYYAMGCKKVTFRKATNTPEKLIKSLEKHFTKMKEAIIAERDINNIYNQQGIPVIYLDL